MGAPVSRSAVASGCVLACLGLVLRVAAFVIAWPLLVDLWQRVAWWAGLGAGLALWLTCAAVGPILPRSNH